jgi:hypothetical protein
MKNRRQTTRTETIASAMVVIGKERFRLNDISNEGIGIVVEGPDTFVLGQRIEAIHFPTEHQDIPLNGIVSHISKNDLGFLCGIRFVYSGTGDFAFVEGLARKYREDIQPPVLDSNLDRNESPK